MVLLEHLNVTDMEQGHKAAANLHRAQQPTFKQHLKIEYVTKSIRTQITYRSEIQNRHFFEANALWYRRLCF